MISAPSRNDRKSVDVLRSIKNGLMPFWLNKSSFSSDVVDPLTEKPLFKKSVANGNPSHPQPIMLIFKTRSINWCERRGLRWLHWNDSQWYGGRRNSSWRDWCGCDFLLDDYRIS